MTQTSSKTAASKAPQQSSSSSATDAEGAPVAPVGVAPVLGPHSANEEYAPVFVQFLECVVMLLRRFPNSFEFNEQLLLFILDELYSARFGTVFV